MPASRWSARLFDFIRTAKRPLTMAVRRADGGDSDVSLAGRSGRQRAARHHLRRRQHSVGGRRGGHAQRPRVVLFALRGWADPAGGRALSASLDSGRPARAVLPPRAPTERCRDIVFVGALVRPSLWQVRLDWTTIE